MGGFQTVLGCVGVAVVLLLGVSGAGATRTTTTGGDVGTCSLSCGTRIGEGEFREDEGANHCNLCVCLGGRLLCTSSVCAEARECPCTAADCCAFGSPERYCKCSRGEFGRSTCSRVSCGRPEEGTPVPRCESSPSPSPSPSPSTLPSVCTRECFGIGGRPCEAGYVCADVPHDGCDAGTSATQCPMCCVRETVPTTPAPRPTPTEYRLCAGKQACYGIGGRPCPAGHVCLDEPHDDCDSAVDATCPKCCVPWL